MEGAERPDVVSHISNSEILIIAKEMKRDLDVKNRVYLFKTYKSCFLGSDAVAWLRERFNNVEEDIKLVQSALIACNILKHVEDDHALKDDYLFYHFTEDLNDSRGENSFEHPIRRSPTSNGGDQAVELPVPDPTQPNPAGLLLRSFTESPVSDPMESALPDPTRALSPAFAESLSHEHLNDLKRTGADGDLCKFHLSSKPEATTSYLTGSKMDDAFVKSEYLNPLLGVPVSKETPYEEAGKDDECVDSQVSMAENESEKKAPLVDPLLGVQVEARKVIVWTKRVTKTERRPSFVVGSLFADDDDHSPEASLFTVKAGPQSVNSTVPTQNSLLLSLTAPTSTESANLFDDDDLPSISDDENEDVDVDVDDSEMVDIDLEESPSRHSRTISEPTLGTESSDPANGHGSKSMFISGVWRCNKCTLVNSKPFAPVCEMCGSSRIEDSAVDKQVVKLQSSLLLDRCSSELYQRSSDNLLSSMSPDLSQSSSNATSKNKVSRRSAEFVEVPLHTVIEKDKEAKKVQAKTMSNILTEEDDLWNEALSRSKGIRDALSIRIVRSEMSSFTSYHIRVIDMSTGFRWIVKRRYRQFYQLHQQMTRLTSEYPWQNTRDKHEVYVEARALRRITALEFPSRRDFATMMARSKPADGAKTKRQVQLEAFLRHVSALVAPVPIGDVREKALLLLQDFLDVDMYKIQLDQMDIFTHGTAEQKGIARVKVKTYQILNDPYTKEGCAILRYLAKFQKMLTEGEKTKEFILGLLQEMAESIEDICVYILEHHKVAKALSQPIQPKKNLHNRGRSVVSNMETHDVSNKGEVEETTHRRIHGRRLSMPAIHLSPFCGVSDLATSDFVADNRGPNNGGSVMAVGEDGVPAEATEDSAFQEKDSEDNEAQAADLVRAMVEDSIFSPTYEDLFTHLSLVEQEKEVEIQRKAYMLRNKSQAFFDIPEPAQSPSGWKDVVCILSELDRHRLPSDKQRVLTAAAHMIAVLHRNEHSERPTKDTVLSADELLPIFIYCIIHSTISSFLVTKDILSYLQDPSKRLGESGYYVAMFEAGIQHIQSMDFEDGD